MERTCRWATLHARISTPLEGGEPADSVGRRFHFVHMCGDLARGGDTLQYPTVASLVKVVEQPLESGRFAQQPAGNLA
jgi:hypothetical protein